MALRRSQQRDAGGTGDAPSGVSHEDIFEENVRLPSPLLHSNDTSISHARRLCNRPVARTMQRARHTTISDANKRVIYFEPVLEEIYVVVVDLYFAFGFVWG